VHLLADLHFRLSQSKTTSDATAIDDCLFGNNFAEDINAAQTVEKLARKMLKKPPQLLSQQVRQPATQRFKQQGNQLFREI